MDYVFTKLLVADFVAEYEAEDSGEEYADSGLDDVSMSTSGETPWIISESIPTMFLRLMMTAWPYCRIPMLEEKAQAKKKTVMM